jgi:hypothetical protein
MRESNISLMTTELAKIGYPVLDKSNIKIGDHVGECEGIIETLEEIGVKAVALPNYFNCSKCKLSEYCSVSKAD